jgi:hypothetical protein
MRGERLGPAWQAMWDAMEDGEWHTRTELIAIATEKSPVEPKTAMNLLVKAAAFNRIQKRTRATRPRVTVEVRRKAEG